jgi:hypothetical protein
MSILTKIAHFKNRRDEVPNQELAKALAHKKDHKSMREIADNLWNENAQVQSDCLKVLYEIGFLNPALIEAYVCDFLKMLESRNNRLVWGSMIALSTIAERKAGEIFAHCKAIQHAMEHGSMITIDNGVKVLALIAAGDDARRKKVFPYLLHHLETCRPKEVPQHALKTLVAVNAHNKAKFIQVLENRMTDMTAAQMGRVKRVIKEAKKR